MEPEITRYETPISTDLIREIWEMWEKVPEDVGFYKDISELTEECSNAKRMEDRKFIYIARVRGNIVGTSAIWVSRKDPKLAEFGLPATSPEYRRQGIGQALFNAPVEDFTDMGGEAIFLGSSSYAFRTYNRAGFRKLVGSPALVYVTSGASPEEYLVDFFRDIGSCIVSSGKYSDNIPAVPLVHTPHDWQILDSNVNLLSLRYSQYAGFAGQVGRFIKLLDTKDSTFFASRAGDREKVVGLSTAVLKPDTNTCNVDGFTHPYYIESWNQLMGLALEWGEEQGVIRFTATVSNEDHQKIDMFKDRGFIEAGKGEAVLLDSMQIVNYENGKKVESILLELA